MAWEGFKFRKYNWEFDRVKIMGHIRIYYMVNLIDGGLSFDWIWPHPYPVTHLDLNEEIPLKSIGALNLSHVRIWSGEYDWCAWIEFVIVIDLILTHPELNEQVPLNQCFEVDTRLNH